MKKKLIVIACMFLYSININIGAACTTPVSGERVWDVAATALDKIDTTESKVCALVSEINSEFSGTFTVEQHILTKVCNSLTLTEQINSSFDQLIVNLPSTFSKLCIINSQVDVLTTQIEDLQVDISGTFTALDGLKTTICSKLEQVSDELGQIETTITLLTQTEIDHAITIASSLSVLQTDVDLLNSALDALDLDANVQGLDSCVDILVSLVDNLDMDVDNLRGTLSNGFAGTFTALDAQLEKACTVESLVDTAEVTAMVDFSGVFTALEALQEKVCSIDSLVDIVCLINARDEICSTASKIDIATSKMCVAQEVILPLPSLSDVIISTLESIEMAGFDQACSNIEVVLTQLDPIASKVDTIESKVCAIDALSNISKLEVINADLITIDSQLDAIDAMTSKLCVIDSKLDSSQQTALTVESLIDVIEGIESSIDVVDDLSQSILSKLCVAEDASRAACSKLEQLISVQDITESKLDLLLPVDPGSLCLDFGTGGLVTTDFAGGNDQANAVVLQPDGKIIAAGRDNNDFGLARYNSDGSLDTTFGTGGLVSTDVTGGTDEAFAAVLQPDGKIIAAGGADNDFGLARYNSDGSLDSTFGTGGLVTTEFGGGNDQAFALVLQQDGKIIAAGRDNQDFGLARYNSDGSLDSTFGTGGLVTTAFGGGNDQAFAVVLQPDGKIIAAGRDSADFGLARYNSDGSLDSTFGTGGLVTTDFSAGTDRAFGLVLQPDGKIIAAGVANGNNFGLARYNSNGSLDSTFGTGGLVTTDFPGGGDQANGVLLQPDDKIIAAGVAGADFALARYNSDGSLDTTFGTAGLVTTNFPGGPDAANAVALKRNGQIIAVGEATIDGDLDFALVCYESGLLPIWSVQQEVELLCNAVENISTSTLISKLCLIEDQVCTIESTLDLVGGLIGEFNVEAQELIGDFQETWTILDVIENKLCTAEPILETITSKLDMNFDFSGVFTEIEAILEKECTVYSKVDSALLLVDDFVSRQDTIDFSSVFTSLDGLLMKVCTVDSQVDVLSSKVDTLATFCGIPIRASDLPLIITTPERYFLAENIDYAGGGTAIRITTDNVFLDLNGYTLNATAGATGGVFITTSTNVQVTNGAITNFTGNGIDARDTSHLIISNMVFLDFGGPSLFMESPENSIVRNLNINASNSGIITTGSPRNCWIRNVSTLNTSGTALRLEGANMCLSDCLVKRGSNLGISVRGAGTTNAVCQRSTIMNATSAGIVLASGGFPTATTVLQCLVIGAGSSGIRNSHDESIIMHNSFISNSPAGLLVPAAITPANSYIAFNTAIENATNYDLNAGNPNAQTLLGNFAFNSTAVGNPDNTNYMIDDGSDITGKFITASQSGSFGDFPTKWHNINMLP